MNRSSVLCLATLLAGGIALCSVEPTRSSAVSDLKVINLVQEAKVKTQREERGHWGTVLPDGTAVLLTQHLTGIGAKDNTTLRVYSPGGFVREREFPMQPDPADRSSQALYTAITSSADGTIYLFFAGTDKIRDKTGAHFFILLFDRELDLLKEIPIDVVINDMLVDAGHMYLAGRRRPGNNSAPPSFPNGVHVYTLDGKWLESFGDVGLRSGPTGFHGARLSFAAGGSRIIHTVWQNVDSMGTKIYSKEKITMSSTSLQAQHTWGLVDEIDARERGWIQKAFPISPLETLLVYGHGLYPKPLDPEMFLAGASLRPVARVSMGKAKDFWPIGVDAKGRFVVCTGEDLFWFRLETEQQKPR